MQRGNTPTGVGKIGGERLGRMARKKHPHGRGEDLLDDGAEEVELETPPRAWGRRQRLAEAGDGGRNTPTGVGKTSSPSP